MTDCIMKQRRVNQATGNRRPAPSDFFGILSRLSGPLVLFGLSTVAQAQGTAADYERAKDLRQLTQNKVFKTQVKPHWFASNARFWYRNDLAGGEREFVLVDAETGTRQTAFDHGRLATALGKAIGREVTSNRLPIDELEFIENEPFVVLSGQG